MEFFVNLIVIHPEQTRDGWKSIEANCGKVTGNVYTMEGDVECLLDDGVVFNLVEEDIIVSSLGGLSEAERIEVIKEASGYDPNVLEFDPYELFDTDAEFESPY